MLFFVILPSKETLSMKEDNFAQSAITLAATLLICPTQTVEASHELQFDFITRVCEEQGLWVLSPIASIRKVCKGLLHSQYG